MIIGLIILALVFCAWPLMKAVFGAANKDAPKVVSNTMRAAALATDALPTMGSAFSNSVLADSLTEVENIKNKLGINDPNIKTMIQLHAYMEQNGYF